MRKLVFIAVVLGLAAGAARLGLGLPPLSLAQYEPLEAIVVGLLAAAPILGIVASLFAMNPTELERAGVGLIGLGGLDARGELQGVKLEASAVYVAGPQGKRRLRQGILARVPAGTEAPPVVVLARAASEGLTGDAAKLEGMTELPLPPGYPVGFRLWISATAAGYRGAQLPPWLDEALARELADLDGVEEIRTGPEGVRVIVLPAFMGAAVTRRHVLLARRLVGTPLDEAALPPISAPWLVPVRRTMSIGFLVAGVLGFVGYIVLCPSNKGTEAEVLAMVHACPPADQALGTWRRKMLGLQTSSTQGKRPKWTLYDILLAGSAHDGEILVVQSEVRTAGDSFVRDGVLLRADLSVGGREIDLLHCGDAVRGAVPRVVTEGKVIAATPQAPAKAGDACTIASERGSNEHNCRFVIRCGATPLYGATPELGYAVCARVKSPAGPALVADDVDEGPRLEPMLRYDERSGTVVLQDPKWKLDILLSRRGGALP